MTPDNQAAPRSTGITRFQMPALIAGIIGMVVSAIAWKVDPTAFYRAYLTSYLFWFSIVAGSLAVLMLQYVTGGEWGILIRRPLGASARTIVVMAVLFLPVLAGVWWSNTLYPWTNASYLEHNAVVRLKLAYLNPTSFTIRTAIYFAIWIFLAWRIRALSLKFYQDRSPYTDLTRRKWAALGLMLFVLTITFTAIDWMMSLEPKWMSSMYGITFLVGCGLSAFAFVTLLLTRMVKSPAMAEIVKASHFRDLGNLMFAFVMFYAYTSFSEFLLIWYANLKEETPHYIVRMAGVWGFLAALVVIFHFFLPFGMLLLRSIKDRAETIGIVAIIILLVRYVAIYWLVAPSWYDAFYYSWISVASLIGVGGIWIYFFIGQLKGQSIIPVHETWVEEAMREGAVKVHG